MGFSILSTEPDGSDPRQFDRWGTTGGLGYDHVYPGGCLSAQWTLDVPAYFTDHGVRPGRLVSIHDGPLRVWRGRLTVPDRASPWVFRAEGLQAATADYAPVDTSDPDAVPTTDPNTALSDARSRGLSVSVPDTTPTVTQIVDPPSTIAELLNQTADLNGQKWSIDRDGHLTMGTPPTEADYLLPMVDTFGRTLDGYATDVWVKFVETTTNIVKMVTAGPASGQRPFGRVETTVDLTDLSRYSTMEVADAQLLADAARTLLGERLTFTNTLTCVPGQLLSPGGLPVRLSTVRAGQVMRLVGAATDAGIGEARYTGGVSVVIGQTSYDAVSDVVQITPWNTTRTDLAGGFEDIYARLPQLSAHRLDPIGHPLNS